MGINAKISWNPPPDSIKGASKRAQAAQKKGQDMLDDFAGKIQKRMQTYPASGSSYNRTGTLGAGWDVQKDGNARIVTNGVEYAQYVEGDRQMPYHSATGWPVLSEVAEQEWNKMKSQIQKVFELD